MAFGAFPNQAFLYYHFALAVKATHSPKKCFDLFKHLISSIAYTNLLPPCSWVSCRTFRLWISLLLAPVTALVSKVVVYQETSHANPLCLAQH
jgi:hypothetical protein